ncbi:putative NACHT domain-containing protein [Seiridium unicorne]|uniref:NACHT domain-containing protein n=1 Tax=Seiridium unicorne TaxID=138068 RepID=A0ABR2UG21_9PEZI
MDRLVFRLRQLPQDADRLDAVQLLSKSLDIPPSAVHVLSLARSADPWVPSKTATLQFEEAIAVQEILERNEKGNIAKSGDEWIVRVENLKDSLVLDTHFRGLTPLYDPRVHIADCIAISGLSSHPFGSWQSKGASKRFMWIRDALPKSLPAIRPILYGYDTTLVNSNSFQSILDLALGLLNQIKANGWNSPTSKPLVFLAHSLGGIVLKQAFVSLANSMQRDDLLRNAIKGAIFFGVPNLGMEQSHLLAMVNGQPNAAIIADLSVNSQYLCQLDKQFSGIAYLQGVQLYWAYETRKSPTVIRNLEGAWERTGAEEILVTQRSAARGLYQVHSRSHSIFPINENHSNMVKFSENDPDYNIVVDKLVQIVAQLKAVAADISQSLDAPKRDFRLEQIEDKFRNTFDWVYDPQEPGFNRWLQKGAGLFWINGKPGSGKSTLMKFIFQDSRTKELLSDWRTSAVQIHASFFFHYRGTAMQKSFEGLLRSVLTQIVEQCKSLTSYLSQLFGDESINSDFWTLSRLQRGLFQILEQDRVPLHICLFLDALDEYDGRLEPICKFLSDIAQIPQTATKRIQICFSSRPWDIFTREFGDCPGFSLQDFTRDDIRDYCLGSIRNERLSTAVLEDLVPELVERSKGVFLWVKLVVKDLAQAFSINTGKQELESLMRALPTELDEYYAEIIERIPHVHRWTAYAMLEIAVRSRTPLTPSKFISALSYSTLKSHTECVAAYEALRNQYLTRREGIDFESLVRHNSRKHCGGMIEIVGRRTISRDEDDNKSVQVFHQTVEDFVMSPRFKTLVLRDLAKVTIENGNSFLAKLYFEQYILDKMMKPRNWRSIEIPDLEWSFLYAQVAEDTAGRSMRYFWESVPKSLGLEIKTLLGFAVHAGLQLLFSEILAEDPEALKMSTEPLITYILRSSIPSQWVAMARLSLGAGFRMDQDPKAFSYLISRTHEYVEAISHFTTFYLDESVDMSRILLERGQSPEVDVQVVKGRLWVIKCKPLHISPLGVAKLLLEHGANVNALDSRGQTPLDYKFGSEVNAGKRFKGMPIVHYIAHRKHGSDRLRERPSYVERYELICLLVSKGGATRKTQTRTIRSVLQEYAEDGWETEALYRALLPAPTSSSKSFLSRFVKFSQS